MVEHKRSQTPCIAKIKKYSIILQRVVYLSLGLDLDTIKLINDSNMEKLERKGGTEKKS